MTDAGPVFPVITVAMATFRRPDCLTRILPELSRQVAESPYPASVLVVDNDPDAGAREQVSSWSDRGVRYVHEPTPGISAARNRALDEAGTADLLIFVDDDELPLPGWLNQHVSSWLEWRCAAVAGPVTARFEGPADAWVRASGVFDRADRRTGATVAGAASNNLLLDLAQLREHGLRFDEQFGISGGSDTRLIHQLIDQGGVVRWCDEAEVLDFIPANRSTREWVLKRVLRTSNTWSRVALDLAPTPAARRREQADLSARALYRIGRGVLTMARGAVSPDVKGNARGRCEIASGRGMLLGAWGRVEHEYRRAPAA